MFPCSSCHHRVRGKHEADSWWSCLISATKPLVSSRAEEWGNNCRDLCTEGRWDAVIFVCTFVLPGYFMKDLSGHLEFQWVIFLLPRTSWKYNVYYSLSSCFPNMEQPGGFWSEGTYHVTVIILSSSPVSTFKINLPIKADMPSKKINNIFDSFDVLITSRRLSELQCSRVLGFNEECQQF